MALEVTEEDAGNEPSAAAQAVLANSIRAYGSKALMVLFILNAIDEFETECQRRGIRLFVLPPRSPKLNGSVERAQRTHTEEFYEVWDLPWTVGPLNRKLRAWERIYNTVRPHQPLGYRTPQQYLRELAHAGKT